MRILIVTHSEISPLFGAGQIAINIAQVLRERGHEVVMWSASPLASKLNWYKRLINIRSKLEDFIEKEAAFDLIDCPAPFVTAKISKFTLIVARSTQPSIPYLIDHIAYNFKKIKFGRLMAAYIVRFFSHFLYCLFLFFLTLYGWAKSKYILCLGSLEYKWMLKYFSFWRKRIGYYFISLSDEDHAFLSEVRLNRKNKDGVGIRFLWIGRWSSEKGIDILINFIKKRLLIHPQDSFTIAGCGELIRENIPSSLILSKRVLILPSFSRGEIYSILANHDIGLFTSRVEGWGISLNEMLESGLTVYATKAGAAVDLLPYFENELKTFPPPEELPLESFPKQPITKEYYEEFNFSKVALIYEELYKKCSFA